MKQLSLLLLVLLAVVPLIQGCAAIAAPPGTDPTSLQLTAATCDSNFNCAPGTAAVGQSIRITAHVVYTGKIAPTREICILDDGSPANCGLTPVKERDLVHERNVATGAHILTATYSGDSVYAKSKSTSLTVNVGPDDSSTSTTPPTSSPAPPSQPSPAQLTVNASSLNFGSIDTGNSNSLSATLTNSGNSSATISSVSVSGSGFNATGLSGIILSPGQSTSVNVSFAPSGSGVVSGSVVVTSNAANSPTTISLSGTGVQPPTLGPPLR